MRLAGRDGAPRLTRARRPHARRLRRNRSRPAEGSIDHHRRRDRRARFASVGRHRRPHDCTGNVPGGEPMPAGTPRTSSMRDPAEMAASTPPSSVPTPRKRPPARFGTAPARRPVRSQRSTPASPRSAKASHPRERDAATAAGTTVTCTVRRTPWMTPCPPSRAWTCFGPCEGRGPEGVSGGHGPPAPLTAVRPSTRSLVVTRTEAIARGFAMPIRGSDRERTSNPARSSLEQETWGEREIFGAPPLDACACPARHNRQRVDVGAVSVDPARRRGHVRARWRRRGGGTRTAVLGCPMRSTASV